MERTFTAVIQQRDDWWIGWIEEVPGVNCQERTRDELRESLKEALVDILELNRAEARSAAGDRFEEWAIAV
jgi:predicted RNase H-like HicB family nuclease